ncbi:MAG: hypothetical protein HQK89_05065 [Nitrospirae bacterium]|nr:hypothetical protein [Nitrospirota bacterium]
MIVRDSGPKSNEKDKSKDWIPAKPAPGLNRGEDDRKGKSKDKGDSAQAGMTQWGG